VRVPSTRDLGQRHQRYDAEVSQRGFTNDRVLAVVPEEAPVPDPLSQRRLKAVLKDFAQVLGSEIVLVYDLDVRGRAKLVSGWGVERAVPISVPKRGGLRRDRVRPAHGGCFVGRALTHRRPAFETLKAEYDANLIDATNPPVTHGLSVPVPAFGGEGDRVLVALFSRPPAEHARALWLAGSYAGIVSLIDYDVDALSGLAQSRIDGLTGCLTYASALHELVREINRSDRAGLPLSCCFIDLDGFKRVNDLNGHVRGNEVLAEVGLVLQEGVRSCDTVGRYGGDEFITILPQTTEEEAVVLAQRVRSLIGSSQPEGLDEPVTASIGVAEWTPGTRAEQLLARADSALFRAKETSSGVAGFNRMNAEPVRRDPALVR
jgi:diguanylate cyclase (GGDEF)-like protein